MPASTYLANKIANHVYRNTAYTSPTAVYVALFTSTASLAELKAGTLTNEVTGGSYARVAATFSAPTDGDAGATTVTFPSATAGWGTIRYVAIMDASTAGNVLTYAQNSSDVTINSGNTYQYNTNALSETVD
jgi:hypothetical protein